MKKLLLIGFLMLFVTVLFAVPVQIESVDYDVGIEQLDIDEITLPVDAEIANSLASCVVATPLKYPLFSENNIYVNKFAANTDNSNLHQVLSFNNMTSVNANNYYIVRDLPQNMNIEGLFRLEIGKLTFCKTLCYNS